MKQSPDPELVISIAQEVVAQVAPDELSSFPAIIALYRRRPERVRRQQAMKDDDLGFGRGDVIQAVAPIILLVVQQVLVKLSNDAAEKGAETLFQRLLPKARHRSSLAQTKQSATPAYQLEDIRTYAFETARGFRIGDARAHHIADALVEKLRARQNEIEGI